MAATTTTMNGYSHEISVDEFTAQPETAWERFKVEGRFSRSVNQLPLLTPIRSDQVRFVCISDTHGQLGSILSRIPPGDVLLHAGDFSKNSTIQDTVEFNEEMGRLPHKHKIVIAGNHEIGYDGCLENGRLDSLSKLGVTLPQQLLTNCTYLHNSGTEAFGLRIWGAPWHPMPGWPFMKPRGQALLDEWNKIPSDTDVLLTHTPPLGHGDFANWRIYGGVLSGCVDLLNTVEQRVRPPVHVFGHIHRMHGVTTNGRTLFVNASICDHTNKPTQNPIIFDLPLPHGVCK